MALCSRLNLQYAARCVDAARWRWRRHSHTGKALSRSTQATRHALSRGETASPSAPLALTARGASEHSGVAGCEPGWADQTDGRTLDAAAARALRRVRIPISARHAHVESATNLLPHVFCGTQHVGRRSEALSRATPEKQPRASTHGASLLRAWWRSAPCSSLYSLARSQTQSCHNVAINMDGALVTHMQ